MKVSCASCIKTFNIPDEKLPMGKKVSFPCPNCREKITLDLRIKPSDEEPDLIEKTAPARSDPKTDIDSQALKEKILRKLGDLPAMPQVVLKARQVMADPNSGVRDVVKVIETDQAITTKILKIANSAFYGMSGKISSIHHASVILGYNVIGELITLASSSGLLDRVLKGYGLGAGDLWLHSMSVAIGSRLIAARKNPALEETSFSAGLIHDAGKLVLDKYVFERKEDFDEFMEHGRETFMSAEQHIFGFNHAEFGFDVCKHWKIPDDISVAIKHHHTPAKSNGNELAYIIYASDAIVNMAGAMAKMGGIGASIENLMYMIDERALKFLALNEADIGTIMGDIKESVGKMAGELSAG